MQHDMMMIGMMAGTAAPVLLLFAAAHNRRGEGGMRLAVLMFGLGYVVAWVGFSACAALSQSALHQTAMLSPAMKMSSRYLAGSAGISDDELDTSTVGCSLSLVVGQRLFNVARHPHRSFPE
jgi:predicted metal-binding membrane protein